MEATTTFRSSWKVSLHRLLQPRRAEEGNLTGLAIVGVGNEQRGDDAAGSLVARELSRQAELLARSHILVVEAGHAPENVTGILRRFQPQTVLLVDAAEMGEAPGTVRWIELAEIDGMTASTHSMPLSMLAAYLRLELGCEVAVLGIQPSNNGYGAHVSSAVRQAVGEVTTVIASFGK